MRRFPDLSIQEKLTRVGMLAAATALVTALASVVVYDIVAFRHDMVSRLTTQAEIVGQNSAAAVIFDDDAAARDTLASVGADEHIVEAILYDEAGRPFATWSREGSPAPPAAVPPAREDGYEFGRADLRLRHRIFFQHTLVGAVELRSDLAELNHRLARYAVIALLVFLGSLVAARLISSRLESAISQPILGLAATARRVSRERDYAVRAPGGGTDEVGLLVETFNDMLGQIEAREVELEEARRLLEQRVLERTSDLRRSEALLAEAQRLARVGSWEWDLRARQVEWSDEMRRLLGLPEGEPAHLDALLDRVHPDDRDAVALALREAAEEGRAFGLDHRVVDPDGTVRMLHTHATVVRGDDGAPLRVVGTGQDVTDRKAAEEERASLIREQLARAGAEAAERRSALLAEVSTLLVGSLEPEGTLPAVARRLAATSGGLCAVAVRGHGDVPPVLAAADPGIESRAREALGAAGGLLAGLEPVPEPQGGPTPTLPAPVAGLLAGLGLERGVLLPLRSGSQHLGNLLLAVAPGGSLAAGEVGLVATIADRLAAALENGRLYRELREANRLKDEFLATLSHELRTPLNAIVGWTKLLQSGDLADAPRQRAVDTIDRNAWALTRLIEDILDVSRIVSGKLRLDLHPLDLDGVVLAAVDALRPTAAAKGVDLEHAPSGREVPVWGDPQRLQQVVWNLLSNAVKSTPAGGRVRVAVGPQDGSARVVVEDTGIGIAPRFLPHVFDRFRQADASSTRAHGGLGLGLAIVRHLAELHGGTVEASSEGEGRGSTFSLRLPLRGGPRPPAAAPAEASAPAASPDPPPGPAAPRLNGISVLVVDDEADTRELVSVVLGRLGAAVTSASSADEALRLFESARPEVLLSDIEMPGGDGYGLLRRIRALGRDKGGEVPAAALTAYARAEDRLAALRAGFQIHLPKPVQPGELAAVVASLAQRAGA